MNYELLANGVTILHTCLIIGLVSGIVIAFVNKRFRPVESLLLIFAIIIWSLYNGCPLTYVENYLRTQAGHATPLLQSGFVSYYVRLGFGWNITDSQITKATYIAAGIFFLLSIDWLIPLFHFKKAVRKIRSKRTAKRI